MRRYLRLLLLGLLSLAAAMAWADEVWIALSEDTGSYSEVASRLRDELGSLPRPLDFRISLWQELSRPGAKPPQLIVTLGAAAFRGMVDAGQRDPIRMRIPILAALLPRNSYEALAPRGRPTSAIFLDQPVGRYFDLLRLVFPERRRVGVILGPDSAGLSTHLGKIAASRGMQLVSAQVSADTNDLYPALRAVLTDAEVLLALPDHHVFNTGSFKNILLATYRQRVPLVAFSEAYVKAGATLALNTSPEQVAHQTALTARTILLGGTLPAPQPALDFTVALNERVAHSLGLAASPPLELAEQLRRQEALR